MPTTNQLLQNPELRARLIAEVDVLQMSRRRKELFETVKRDGSARFEMIARSDGAHSDEPTCFAAHQLEELGLISCNRTVDDIKNIDGEVECRYTMVCELRQKCEETN